jgi:hypothetical protein
MLKKLVFAAALAIGFVTSFHLGSTSGAASGPSVQLLRDARACGGPECGGSRCGSLPPEMCAF